MEKNDIVKVFDNESNKKNNTLNQKLTVEEYDKEGEDYTQQKLKELEDQMKNKNSILFKNDNQPNHTLRNRKSKNVKKNKVYIEYNDNDNNNDNDNINDINDDNENNEDSNSYDSEDYDDNNFIIKNASKVISNSASNNLKRKRNRNNQFHNLEPENGNISMTQLVLGQREIEFAKYKKKLEQYSDLKNEMYKVESKYSLLQTEYISMKNELNDTKNLLHKENINLEISSKINKELIDKEIIYVIIIIFLIFVILYLSFMSNLDKM